MERLEEAIFKIDKLVPADTNTITFGCHCIVNQEIVCYEETWQILETPEYEDNQLEETMQSKSTSQDRSEEDNELRHIKTTT